MALTIQQIQNNITAKNDAREIINQIADYLQANPSGGASYLVYNVQIGQAGSANPSAIVFADTIGFSTWVRTGVGSFRCASSQSFDATKTQICGVGQGASGAVVIPITDFSKILGYVILSYDGNGGFLTMYIDVLDGSFLSVELSALLDSINLPEIRIYP